MIAFWGVFHYNTERQNHFVGPWKDRENMKNTVLIVFSLLLACPAFATDRLVPGQYGTIQAGIDAAVNGDTVIIADGLYAGYGYRDIDFGGKAITVRSENGPANCIIDCDGTEAEPHRGFLFQSGEGASSILAGFTITNGYAKYGGGIHCENSSPTIINCKISGNEALGGGGIYLLGSSAVIKNCMISGNWAVRLGGGVDYYGSSPTITNCTIASNEEVGVCGWSGSCVIKNSILWDNSLLPWQKDQFVVTYSDVQGGWEGQGNIDVDPLLTPDGHLRAGSPCINLGDPDGDFSGQVDIDSEPRITGAGVDMGSDEFLDSDLDGLPDWWENRYFGSPTAAEADADPDMDGHTNLTEYELYSSDPTIAAVTYYVDAQDGDDAYDGLSPVWDGQHGPKRTIQAGIDTARHGDTVIVEPGRYYENICFLGKAITVRSTNPTDWDVVKNTIIDARWDDTYIDGRRYGSCVLFDHGEDSSSILEGFTLTRGAGTAPLDVRRGANVPREFLMWGKAGGGILCLSSSPTIRHCNISGNGRRRCYDYWRYDCYDYYVEYGGAIALLGDCRATISSCFIVNNGVGYRGVGAGIIIASNTPETATSTITNCTIANNLCEHCKYECYQVDCSEARPAISNTIIWGDYIRSLLIADPSLVTYSCVKDAYIFEGEYDEYAEPYDLTAAGGNISGPPRFVRLAEPDLGGSDSDYIEPPPGDTGGDEPPQWDGGDYYQDPDLSYPEPVDYHLQAISPCVNAGDPDFTADGQTDIDGQPRVMAGRVDIGADEVVPQIIVDRPAAGEVFSAGSTHEVKWSSYGAGSVDILFSENAGGNWLTVEAGLADTGGYLWQLPARVDSNQCLISVVPSIPDSDVVCVESGLFTIQRYPRRPDAPPGLARKGVSGQTGLSKNYGPELGCIKWQFETEGPVTASVTIGGDDRVYIPCEDGKLYTLDADGCVLWTYDTNSPIVSSPAAGYYGMVYIADEAGKLYAINGEGRVLWTHTTDGPVYSSPTVSPDGRIYICSLDGVLYALAADGSELWSFQTHSRGSVAGSIFASPTIADDGAVYIAGLYDPNLYALNPDDGSIKWACSFRFPAESCDPDIDTKVGWPFASPAVAADGTIYQTLLYDPNLYAIEPDTGAIIWSTNLADPCSGWFEEPYYYQYGSKTIVEYHLSGSGWSRPALGPDGTIYVSFDDPYLRAVEPDGSIKWASRLGMVGGFTLTVGSDGLIYAASDDSHLYVVEPDGRQIAQFQGDNWLSFPTITADDTIIVSDANNTVWAIKDDGCDGLPAALHRPQDLNADWAVDYLDLALLAADWLDSTDWQLSDYYGYYTDNTVYLTGDIDKDLYVDFDDFAELANRWLSEE